jgi:hypothetical protein
MHSCLSQWSRLSNGRPEPFDEGVLAKVIMQSFLATCACQSSPVQTFVVGWVRSLGLQVACGAGPEHD